MNLKAYDVDSLRKIVRELQEENEELREQLHRQNIPAAESQAFLIRRNDDLYDPDQGARIEHPFIIKCFKDVPMYMQGEAGRADTIRSVRGAGVRNVHFKMAAATIV